MDGEDTAQGLSKCAPFRDLISSSAAKRLERFFLQLMCGA